MAPDVRILLQPRYPADDDPDLLGLLDVLANLVGGTALELEIALDGRQSTAVYVRGELPTETRQLRLEEPERFRAILRMPADAGELDRPAQDLVVLSLSRILSSHRLRQQVSLLRGALDATTSAVLLFQDEGAIVYANPPGDQLLCRQTEDELVMVGNGHDNRPLVGFLCSKAEELLSGARPEAAWRGTVPLSDGSLLVCELLRIDARQDLPDAAVLAVLQPVTTAPEHLIEEWASWYSLSGRETQVLALLAEGLPSSEISRKLGISPHTVRDHLKSLYRKTGCSSRVELQSHLAAGGVTHR